MPRYNIHTYLFENKLKPDLTAPISRLNDDLRLSSNLHDLVFFPIMINMCIKYKMAFNWRSSFSRLQVTIKVRARFL